MRKIYLLLPALLAVFVAFGQAPTLPFDFESTTINYTFTNFDGGGTTKIANPQAITGNTSANVGRMIKSAGQPWGGSFISMATPFDFSVNKTFKVKVFMPRVGAKMLLKVENETNGTINFEREATGTVANAWEELSFDYSTISTTNQYQKLVIIFDLGTPGDGSANFTYLFDDIILTNSSVNPPTGTQMNLPVTFDDAAVNYGLAGFGGAEASTIVTDPTLGTNKVAQVIKGAAAELWAGTTITAVTGGIQTGFATRIPFTATNKKMTVRVWSPDAGIKVRLKVEDHTDATKSVETEATTTVANGWETLTFDFANQATGTAALNLGFNYNKASIFFNFGVTGAVAGAKTYYFDDVQFDGTVNPPPSNKPILPVDFESTTIDYTFTNFDGGDASKVANPQINGTNTSANVGKLIKNAGQVWGGSWIALASPIDFSTNKIFKIKVFMPRVGAKLLLKAENMNDGAIYAEKEVAGTVANAWEELSFDFSTVNTANQYQKLVFIFDLGTAGDGSANFTYLFDDIRLTSNVVPPNPTQMNLPVTFDSSTIEYGLVGFGGAEASTIETDPTLPGNKVAKVIKTSAAELWAGTTITAATGGIQTGFSTRIPFTATETKMNIRVWSPDAGIKVRLKVEDFTDGTKSVETEATSTVAGGWETLVFDFANQANGTAALNLTYNYNKASIFFNFGVTGAVAGTKTYYFDDVKFGAVVTPNMPTLPLTFESSTINYIFTDFDGGSTSSVANPEIGVNNSSAHVARMVKNPGQVWGGSWIMMAAPIDFTTNKFFKVKVWMPRVGAKLLLKAEHPTDGGIYFEKEVTSTVANAWEDLTFDFSTINTSNQYQKIVLIFDLGTAGDGSANFTYLFDDIRLVESALPVKLTSFKASVVNNTAAVKWITASELNHAYYEVERSLDGIHFETRGRINGNGTSNNTNSYQFTDELAARSTVAYYRLKIVDIDGRFTYSIVATLRYGTLSVNTVSVFPNPFTTALNVSVFSEKQEMAVIQLIAMNGTVVDSRSAQLLQGANQLVLNNFGKLSKGTYVLKITTANAQVVKSISTQ